MAAHRITPANAAKNKIELEFETEDGVVHALSVRKWHYRPKAMVIATEAWIKEQQELHAKGKRDAEPTELEMMIFTIGLIDPELSKIVDDLSLGEQFEIWQTWQEVVPVTEGESEASSDS